MISTRAGLTWRQHINTDASKCAANAMAEAADGIYDKHVLQKYIFIPLG